MNIYDTGMAGNYFWIYFSCWINWPPCKKVAVAEFCMLASPTGSVGKAIQFIHDCTENKFPVTSCRKVNFRATGENTIVHPLNKLF